MNTIERNEDLGNGNFITLTSNYTKIDGTKFLSADVIFKEEPDRDKIQNNESLDSFILNLTDKLNKFHGLDEIQYSAKEPLNKCIIPSETVNKLIEDLNSYSMNDTFLSFMNRNIVNDTSSLQVYGTGIL